MYKDTFYKRIEGCATGSSISSVIAQIVMEALEETTMNNMDIHLPFFYSYVDDCITEIPEDSQGQLKQKFNNYQDRLKFTVETENEGIIKFLDTLHFTTK